MASTAQSSPYISEAPSVQRIMAQVLLALLPAIGLQIYCFGWTILTAILISTLTALLTEAAMLKARGVPPQAFLADLSVVVTAWLIALSLPPVLPWWMNVLGTAFAVVVAKHLYGGLGNNPFNPAMIAYAVLIVAFPAQMTRWPAPLALLAAPPGFLDQLLLPFAAALPDAISMATPLDTLKTQLALKQEVSAIRASHDIFGPFGGRGGEWVALAYLAGGVFLLGRRIITWHLPLSFLAGFLGLAALLHALDPARHASGLFHLFSGATLIGAFFIATDPVSGPTTRPGQLLFGAGVGMLAYLIRAFGGYPDGVAFAVLLGNCCVPLIDMLTRPPSFGHKGERR
ncbi:Ion-translocating oxidoreductase complex subunit D [Burkholderiales bacterium]|nr:MAG: RnfABCDGE type electron transport complex subunit D [Burkholderiales bacterium]CAG0989621.1 Ion-translocating oxidoreductase complex subunit D [Burkholderiales bacterium]